MQRWDWSMRGTRILPRKEMTRLLEVLRVTRDENESAAAFGVRIRMREYLRGECDLDFSNAVSTLEVCDA